MRNLACPITGTILSKPGRVTLQNRYMRSGSSFSPYRCTPFDITRTARKASPNIYWPPFKKAIKETMCTWMGTWYDGSNALLVIPLPPCATYHFTCQMCSPLLEPLRWQRMDEYASGETSTAGKRKKNHAWFGKRIRNDAVECLSWSQLCYSQVHFEKINAFGGSGHYISHFSCKSKKFISSLLNPFKQCFPGVSNKRHWGLFSLNLRYVVEVSQYQNCLWNPEVFFYVLVNFLSEF